MISFNLPRTLGVRSFASSFSISPMCILNKITPSKASLSTFCQRLHPFYSMRSSNQEHLDRLAIKLNLADAPVANQRIGALKISDRRIIDFKNVSCGPGADMRSYLAATSNSDGYGYDRFAHGQNGPTIQSSGYGSFGPRAERFVYGT